MVDIWWLDQERRASAKIGFAALGFLCASYDLFVVQVVANLASPEAREQGSAAEILEAGTDTQWVSVATYSGFVLGSVAFGFLADSIGRFTTHMLSTSFLVVASLLTAVLPSRYNTLPLLYSLRVLAGISIGAKYPILAAIAVEAKLAKECRGRDVTRVFACQGIASVIAAFFVWGLVQLKLGPAMIWRIALGVSAIPSSISIYFSYRYAKVLEPPADRLSWREISVQFQFSQLKNYKTIILWTSLTWFVFDVIFYPGFVHSDFLRSQLVQNRSINCGQSSRSGFDCFLLFRLFAASFAVPGYYAAAFIVDRVGRKSLLVTGFTAMIIVSGLLGLDTNLVHDDTFAFVKLYGLMFFFANMGPNVCTFLLTAELVPHQIRCSVHGLAAAAGKLGAIVGIGIFHELRKHIPKDNPSEGAVRLEMMIISILSIVGVIISIVPCIPEMNQQPLPDLKEDDSAAGQERALLISPTNR